MKIKREEAIGGMIPVSQQEHSLPVKRGPKRRTDILNLTLELETARHKNTKNKTTKKIHQRKPEIHDLQNKIESWCLDEDYKYE